MNSNNVYSLLSYFLPHPHQCLYCQKGTRIQLAEESGKHNLQFQPSLTQRSNQQFDIYFLIKLQLPQLRILQYGFSRNLSHRFENQ